MSPAEPCNHALLPDEPHGYVERSEWAQKKLRTHEQKQCPKCGLWAFWVERDSTSPALTSTISALEHARAELDSLRAAGLTLTDATLDLAAEHAQTCVERDQALEALEELRPTCEACGEPATRLFFADGDGRFWLCSSEDESHGTDYYCGEQLPCPDFAALLGEGA